MSAWKLKEEKNKQTIKKNRSGTIERHPSLLWNVWDCHEVTSILLFPTGTSCRVIADFDYVVCFRLEKKERGDRTDSLWILNMTP